MARIDMNVWNKVADETYGERDGWVIDLWECNEHWSPEGFDPFMRIELNDTQAKMLTLGVANVDGGDYDWDSDFWIDPAGFLDTYKNIPRKVTRYLTALDTTWED